METGGEHTNIVWARVDAIVNIILQNTRYLEAKRNKELVDLICKTYNIGSRQAERYVKEAKKLIKDIARTDLKKNLERALFDREMMFNLAKGESDKGKLINADVKLMLEVAKDRDKILGLYTENHNVSGNISISNIDFAKLNQDQLNKILSVKSEDELKNIIAGIVSVQG